MNRFLKGFLAISMLFTILLPSSAFGVISDNQLFSQTYEPAYNTSFIPQRTPDRSLDIEIGQNESLFQPLTTASWNTSTNNSNATTFTRGTNNVMSIATTQFANARYLRSFAVTPNRYYRFTVQVHSNAQLTQDTGATVLWHFNDGWSRWGNDSYNHSTNNTWQTLEVQFNSGTHSNVFIELGHGFFWGNEARGTTQFRNLRLEEMTSTTTTNWRVLNVIPRHVDFNNRRISIDANDITNIQNHGPRWAQTIARMSNNQMSATVTTVVLEDSINQWHSLWNSFWPGHGQLHHMLRRNGIDPHDFDYIMVSVRTNCPNSGINIPTPDWGGLAWNYSGVSYGIQTMPAARGTTWWNGFGHPGAYIHEFLHALETNAGTGNIVDHANNFELNDGRHPPHHFQYPGFGYNMFYIQFLRRQLRVRATTGTAIAGQTNFGVPAAGFRRQRLTPSRVIYDLPVTASITEVGRTSTTLSFSVTFPVSGAFGNRLELWDSVTGQWREIGSSMNLANGTYTFTNLPVGRVFVARVTFLENGSWRTVDIHASTLAS